MGTGRALGAGVTAPRQILPGTVYLVTRRCSERRFFLRPSTLTNEIFLFVLAVAAERFEIKVHAYCVLSNHYHLVVTDVHGTLPAFMQYLGGLVARATNATIGHWEGFWSSEVSYSAVSHASPDDVIAKVAYVLANPVAAALVSHGRDWPGLRTAPEQLGSVTLVARRPKKFFREHGDMPETASLTLTAPAGFASAAEFRARAAEATHALESRWRREHQLAGRSILGRARILAQRPFARPAPGEPRRQLNPRVAARDKWKRIEALGRWTGFTRAYRDAWDALQAGVRDVLFPAGTYLMRIRFGARCAPMPTLA
jgi:REP element-mobilizing transposase RayT